MPGARGDRRRPGQPEGARAASPRPSLRLVDAVALVVGIVIGAGIFRAPPAVAANAPGAAATIAAWIAGGVVSLAGAMCYAELAATYPHAGGDYHYLGRALGRVPAFLFAWARLTVIPTGSVALLAFVFGDYAAELAGDSRASAPFAAALVIALTALNAAGVRLATRVQLALTAALVVGLLAVIAAGFLVAPDATPAGTPPSASAPGSIGLAMVFVLLAYGGWNEAAYVSTELRGGRRAMAAALASSLALVAVLYVLANAAMLRGLGLEALRASTAPAADLLARAIGPLGAHVIAAVVAAAALTSANATLFMGSRMAWAFGREFPMFSPLGAWSSRAETPIVAVAVQGALSLALVAVGALSRHGFETMVAYTAPVFWLFLLLAGISLFVLRRRDPAAPRPFEVPLYPLTPVVFCAACAFLLWSSVAYAGPGAALGLAVLAAGLVPLWLSLRRLPRPRRAAA